MFINTYHLIGPFVSTLKQIKIKLATTKPVLHHSLKFIDHFSQTCHQMKPN